MYDDYYFDRDEEDVLHDAYWMAVERGYTDEQLLALAAVIRAETRFGDEALQTE